MTPTQTYIESLKSGPCPTAKELSQLCTELHRVTVDAGENFPEFNYMSSNFEDMADVLSASMEFTQ